MSDSRPPHWKGLFPGASAERGGCCLSAPATVLARNWPRRCGSRPATSPRPQPERTPPTHVAPGAIDVAFRHGLDLDGCKPRLLDEVAREEDLVITVCDNAHEELPGLGGIHWSIPDPLRLNSKEAFEDAFADISRRVHDLAPRLSAA